MSVQNKSTVIANKKFQSYIHISTAYSNSFKKNIDEIIYKSEFNTNDLIKSIEILPNDAVEAMAKTLRVIIIFINSNRRQDVLF